MNGVNNVHLIINKTNDLTLVSTDETKSTLKLYEELRKNNQRSY